MAVFVYFVFRNVYLVYDIIIDNRIFLILNFFDLDILKYF